MKTKYNSLSKPELDFIKDNCNFTPEEVVLLEMAAQDKSDAQIADELNVSDSTITKRKKRIKAKIIDFLEVSNIITTIYVNGKKVNKDNLKDIEIQIDAVKCIIKDKLTGKK